MTLRKEDLEHWTDSDKLRAIHSVIRNYDLDETAGDWTERAETILFIITNGEEGKDWGHYHDLPRITV